MALTRAQRAAASHRQGHALVLAGPGTGKTTTLIERCRLLLANGVPLNSLFVTTFTKKAAIEIQDRLKDIMSTSSGKDVIDKDEVLKNSYIDTFHSLCARLIKRFPMDVGLPYDFKIISDDDQRQILYGLGIEWDEEDGSYIDYISRWKDTGVDPAGAMEEARNIGDKFSIGAAKAYERYEDECHEKNYVDFSDLISLATEVLKANGEGAKWFRSNFSHFIVDEFQDTNLCQIEFLKAAVGKYGMLWAVGDEDQSLYEWRGSNPSYCLNFKELFSPAKIYQLVESFRCSPQIIKMSGKLIEHNVGRFEKSIKPARPGKQGEQVMFKAFGDSEAEASWIARNLKRFKDAGGNLKNVAILFRTGGTVNTIQRHLEKNQVPFRLMGTRSFWSLREVSLFILTVAAINNDRRFDIFNGFGESKHGSNLRRFSKEMKGEEKLTAIANPLARILYEMRPDNFDAERRASWMASVEAIMNIFLETDDQKAFLDLAHKRQNEEGDALTGDRVYLSTLHSAKGLEWDMVFLAGAEDDQMPHFKSNNVEEERRLFYVGLTRARHRLIVTYSRKRYDRARNPSRFLRESALSEKENVGDFKWIESKKLEDAPKAASAVQKKHSPTKASKSYRRKGGRSLIPPDESKF